MQLYRIARNTTTNFQSVCILSLIINILCFVYHSVQCLTCFNYSIIHMLLCCCMAQAPFTKPLWMRFY